MLRALSVLALTGCTAIAPPRFPPEVSAALADEPTRRLETEHLVVYYPAARATQARRFATYADRCAAVLKAQAVVKNRFWAEKIVIAMPELAFNNAFVMPPLAGLETIAVIPTFNTLDFATEFGLPPDPRFVACHELVHYVHVQQIDGLWGALDTAFGALVSPQVGFDLWFFEGLATHFETALQNGIGRPRWPIFTGMFAAAYAGGDVGGGDLDAYGRRSPVGHHYLVGAMFVDFLVERYGERALWVLIGHQAKSQAIITSVAGRFKDTYGRSLGDLLGEFRAWVAAKYPRRARPPGQAQVAALGADARYARGRDGTEAWVTNDVDEPARLVVRAPDGTTLADTKLVELIPPREVVIAAPLLVSGLSVTANGQEVWLTAIDLAGTDMTTRLLRWRRGDGLDTVASGLGPGATITPDGSVYYYLDVDGDRWRLARYTIATREKSIVFHVPPGQYVLAAQLSADAKRIVASVWNGSKFVLWLHDATTGAFQSEIADPAGPVYDGAFLDDGRVIRLGVVAGRFQVIVRNADGTDTIATDAPYAALAPRAAGKTIRFLDREGWRWEVAEVAIPPPPAAGPSVVSPQPSVPEPTPAPADDRRPTTDDSRTILSDTEYSYFDRLFIPTLRAPTFLTFGPGIPLLGIVLAGGDRLGFQRWSVAGFVQIGVDGRRTHLSGAASYVNAMLAPWLVFADASSYRYDLPEEDIVDPDLTVYRSIRTREASLGVGRTWRGTIAATLSALVVDDLDGYTRADFIKTRLGGPALALGYDAVEGTPYTDIRRELALSASTGWYPDRLSTFDEDLYDVGAALRLAHPVPFTKRHILTGEARGRAILHRSDAPADLLEVGGYAALFPLWQRTSVPLPDPLDDLRFPPGMKFAELVRGFEDLPKTTDRAAIGHISWRYPLIIDRGIASTWFLSSSFLRQVDLELFGAGWIDLGPGRARTRHGAAGAAVTLRIALLRVPLQVQYQISRRFSDDQAWLHVVGLGPDL